MKRYLAVFLLGGLPLLLSAASPDLSKYKDLTETKLTEPVLLETFDRAQKDWKQGTGFKAAPGDGVHGTTAMLYHRTDAGYPAIAVKSK